MGKFDEFNPELESWDAYAERFEFYCIAEEISDGGIKKATLLSRLGVKAYNKLRDLAQPETLMDTDLVTCKKLLKEYYAPPQAEREEICRYRFNSYKQQPGQSISDFIAELRRLSVNCNYANALEKQLRDRIVQGVRDQALVQSLLEDQDLTLAKAVSTCLAFESAVKGVQEIQKEVKASSGGNSEKVQKMYQRTDKRKRRDGAGGSSSPGNFKPCYRCGKSHNPRFCRFKDASCHNCGKRGHIAPMCKNEKQQKSGEFNGSRKFYKSK